MESSEEIKNPELTERVHVDVSHSCLNVYAEEFVPRQDSPSVEENDFVEFNTLACLVELSQSPHEFDEIFNNHQVEFSLMLEDEELTCKLCCCLLMALIKEPNSQYIGVRLMKKLKEIAPSGCSYLKVLLNCLQLDFEKLLEDLQTVNPEAVRRMSLLIAEIYVQLEDINGHRFALFPDVIMLLCNELIKSTIPQHIYTLCLILKLTGQSLIDDSCNDLNKLIDQLRNITLELDNRTKTVISGVIVTYDTVWQLKENVAPSKSSTSETDDATLYGPDGSELSIEESSFLKLCMEEPDNKP